mmetsp:Transcript_30844/g.63911  ORF Transcript_30844/g.63911 Transcript_30844/m.63911 type:complete len:89 (-) Transcript_30844:86-352(-)
MPAKKLFSDVHAGTNPTQRVDTTAKLNALMTDKDIASGTAVETVKKAAPKKKGGAAQKKTGPSVRNPGIKRGKGRPRTSRTKCSVTGI